MSRTFKKFDGENDQREQYFRSQRLESAQKKAHGRIKQEKGVDLDDCEKDGWWGDLHIVDDGYKGYDD